MHYEIHHGYKTGKQLTPVQRASGTFAEEPIVLGKVFRRGMKPMMLTEQQFAQHKAPLLRLLLSGSIEILVVDENKVQTRLDYKAATGISPRPVVAPVPDLPPAGDGNQPAPASKAESEEQEAGEPPSSAPVEPPAPEPANMTLSEPVPPEPEVPAVEVPAPAPEPQPVPQVAQKKSKRG